MIVRNIPTVRVEDENVPKRCLGSQRAAYIKEVLMLVSSLMLLLAPLPYYLSDVPGNDEKLKLGY